jgi:predicted SnoaL-like aldol condensation-catalyzing enzyme
VNAGELAALADYFRLEGGKVKDHWGVMDSGAMLMQMGVVQMPGA